ncbi:MAG: lipid II flippase MurJ [Intestinibacter bartlettii]
MSRTAKNAVIIMVATLLSRVLGFLRETILANFYGTSMVADVFVLTFNIPGLIISIVGSVIYMMYIPMYYDTRDRLGENEALKFTNNILNILSVFSIIVSILGIIFKNNKNICNRFQVKNLTLQFNSCNYDVWILFISKQNTIIFPQ